MAKLKIKDDRGKERLHELVDDVTSIGRASSNTIQITDEKSSRNHFRIEKSGSAFRLIDLGSTNGTKLNGARIGAEIDLKAGDQLCVGKTTFTFDDGTQPKKEEPQPAPDMSGGETVEMDPVKPAEVKAPEPAKAEADSAPKFVLKMLEGKTPGKVYELGVSALTIGRHSSNTIHIIDDAASNYHAEIGREPIGYVLTDLGSTNGTRVKLKNKTDFEKVIKTPLSVGMQIRVGKTLLEFDNLGKPVEDEALFGTVALDPQKFDQALANPSLSKPRSGSRRVLAALVILALLAGGAGAAYKLHTPSNGTAPPPPPTTVALKGIPNGDFEEGPDGLGNPKHFTVRKAAPNVRVGVTPDARHKDSPGKYGLEIGKPKNPSKPTIVETEDVLPIVAGKTYEFTGFGKNSGDGVFALYVRWISGDRTYSECPVVFQGEQSEWCNLKAVLSPPAWATKAVVGVLVQGTEGKAYFDQLDLKFSTESPTPAPQVNYGGVTVAFEGTKGCFAAIANSAPVVLDGMLLLVNGDATLYSDLSIARDQTNLKEGEKVSISGGLMDFALQEPRGYRIEAAPGAAGVDMRAVVNAGADAGCQPQLSFAVVGALATGDLDVTHGGDTPERMSATESKQFPGVKEVLFNAGKSPQLVLLLPNGADVDLKRQGNRRQLTVKFNMELAFGFALESPAQKSAMKTLIADLRKSMQDKQWGVAEAKIKELRNKFETRFPDARDEAAAGQLKLDGEYHNAKLEIDRKIQTIKEVKTPTACDAAKDVVDRIKTEWSGSEHIAELDGYLSQIAEHRKSVSNDDEEKAAGKLLGQAQAAAAAGIYNVAIAFLDQVIKLYPNSKAAEKAKVLRPEYSDKFERKSKLEEIKSRIEKAYDSYEKAGSWKTAADKIQGDPEYQKNQDDLPELKEKLKYFLKKAAEN